MYYSRFVPLSVVFWTLRNLAAQKSQEVELLQNAMNALHNGLQFMENHVAEINLDGAFGCRLLADLIDGFLEYESAMPGELRGPLIMHLKQLSTKAGRIADEAQHYVKINDPKYYEAVGGLLDRSKDLIWYPGRLTESSLIVPPLPCPQSVFNETASDHCLNEILHSRVHKNNNRCNLSKECLKLMTKPRQRGYALTHQVLYFQIAEKEDCVKRSKVQKIPKLLQDTLCSNVMRDATEIADSGYPLNHQDLFMEQIGLCGLWGYKDFYKPDWLAEILQWQQTSGCYTDRAKWHCTENLRKYTNRIKREEKILEDGCLSHKTTVALFSIAANIRFLIEKLFQI